MRRMQTLLAVLSVFIVFPALAACRDGGGSINQDQLITRLSSDNPPLLLDVRTPQEFAIDHIPGAVNIPYDQLPNRLAELGLSKNRELVVYCETGGRAAIAEATLRKAAFQDVLHLEGDMSHWRRHGHPIEHGVKSRHETGYGYE
ncbi:MAG: rhodanese-like domain-containing protein [Candidatus Binatia bacterium]